MEWIELELLTEEKVTYRYYPEGKEAFGIVSLMRKTRERIHDKPCPEGGSMYVMQVWPRLEKYQEAGNFPERDQIAWY